MAGGSRPPEFDTNRCKWLICIARVKNSPLQQGELSVEGGLLELEGSQDGGLVSRVRQLAPLERRFLPQEQVLALDLRICCGGTL